MTDIILSENETVTEVNDGIRLIQNKKGLTFGTDALMLAAFIRSMPSCVGVEYGSGSGIISLLLAKRGKLKTIHALEVQQYYAMLTGRNAELNGLDGIITVHNCDARNFSGEYDVVFSNPPYMKENAGKKNCDDGKYAARHEANGNIDDFCAAAAGNLKFGGLFYCVYRPDRLIDLISSLRKNRLEPKRMCFVHATCGHKPCLVLIESKLGANPSCEVMRPLFLTDTNGDPTNDAEQIYDTGMFYE